MAPSRLELHFLHPRCLLSLLLLAVTLGSALAGYRVQTLFEDPGCNSAYTVFMMVDLVTNTTPCAAAPCSHFPGDSSAFTYTVTCVTSAPDFSGFPLATLRYTSTDAGPATCSVPSGDLMYYAEAYRPLTSCQYYPPHSIPDVGPNGVLINLFCNISSTPRYYLYRHSLAGCLLGGTLTTGVGGCTVDLVDVTDATYVMIGASCRTNSAPRNLGLPLLLLGFVVMLTSRALLAW